MQNPFEITLENQADDEEILKVWRHHPFTFIGPALRILAFAAIPLLLLIVTGFALFSSIILFVLFLAILAITVTYAAHEWVSWYSDIFVLTNYRVVDVQQEGFFSRKFSEAALASIQDVSHEVSGIFHTMLNFGDVLVQTAGTEAKIKMRDIADPQSQAVLILKEQQKRTAAQDTALSAEDLIRLLAKHKKDLDQIADDEKGKKVEDVEEQLKRERKKKTEAKIDTDKSEKIQ